MNKIITPSLLVLVTSLVAAPAHAVHWPRWLGPDGNNVAPGSTTDLDLTKWKVAWKAGVGRGYSSIAVAGNRAFTLGHDGKSQETVSCLDTASGAVLWQHAYDAQLLPTMHPGGPNATPTITGERVLTVSKDGQVFCFAADKGTVLWRTSLVDDAGLKLPKWGFAASPVVDGDRVLLAAGKVIALNLATGKALWTSATDYQAGYTTAVVFERAGARFIAALDGKGLAVLTAKDGQEIARRPFKAMFDMTASTPYALTGGQRLLISGNTSSELLDFDGAKLTSVWSSTEVKNAMNNSVIFDGVLYGIDGRQGSPDSRFVSVNVADGKVNWIKPAFGYGTTIGVGRTVLALTENGELVTVKAGADGYHEISRQQVLTKVCWTPPAFAGDRIFVRNDRGDLVCLAGT